jgi:hypothetical protein
MDNQPRTTHEAIQNLNNVMQHFGITVGDAIRGILHTPYLPPPDPAQTKWMLRTKLRDGSPIIDAPSKPEDISTLDL